MQSILLSYHILARLVRILEVCVCACVRVCVCVCVYRRVVYISKYSIEIVSFLLYWNCPPPLPTPPPSPL
jgi:hypothetical protein